MLTVYESGLYELIFVSRKPEAKVFKRWIIEEVLPSIRKTGSYSVSDDLDSLELEVKELRNRVKRHKLEKEKRILTNQLDLIENPLTGFQLRILKIVNKKGECTASEIRNALGGSKSPLSAFEIGELALQLVALNKLEKVLIKNGVRVKSL
jgi:BRO family, N-terminal domain